MQPNLVDIRRWLIIYAVIAYLIVTRCCANHVSRNGCFSTLHDHELEASYDPKVLNMMNNPSYKTNLTCEWLITANYSDTTIVIEVTSIETECMYDTVYIYDGDSFNSSLIAVYSGVIIPRKLYMSSNKVLVYFFSDLSQSLKGFQLTYSVVNNNDINRDELVRCDDNQRCLGGDTKCVDNRCQCDPDKELGVFCSLGKTTSNNKHTAHLLNYEVNESPLTYAGLTVVSTVCAECTNHTWIFGGYNLNQISGTLYRTAEVNRNRVPDFRNPVKITTNQLDSYRPIARYSHRMVAQLKSQPYGEETLFVHGGITSRDGMSITGDFWKYSVTNNMWTQLSPTPVTLADHCMVILGNRWIYVFGGRTTTIDDSPIDHMYSYDILYGIWTREHYRTGHRNRLKLAGHTCNYHEGVIYVFGGYTHRVSKFLQVSNTMWFYHVGDKIWTELKPIDQSFKPPQLAHHVSVEYSNSIYMIGGENDTNCLYKNILIYDIKCHKFSEINHVDIDNTQLSRSIAQTGHDVIILGPNSVTDTPLLLVYGGVQGALVKDVWALPVNSDPSEECMREKCAAQSECNGCVLSVDCNWCPSRQLCIPFSRRDLCPKVSWTNSNPISNISACITEDRPLGWHFTIHYCQPDLQHPDEIHHIKTSKIRWWIKNYFIDTLTQNDDCYALIVLRGVVRNGNGSTLSDLNTDPNREWTLTARNSNVTVYTFDADREVELGNLRLLTSSYSTKLRDDFIISTDNTSYIKIYSQIRYKFDSRYSGDIAIQTSPQIKFNNSLSVLLQYPYMQPFSSGLCNSYIDCKLCSADWYCGWCGVENECMSRNDICNNSWLITRPDQCYSCQDYTDCRSCINAEHLSGVDGDLSYVHSIDCDWLPSADRCVRRGSGDLYLKPPFNNNTDKYPISNGDNCPDQCDRRKSCSECLQSDECVWCSTHSHCLPMDELLITYQYGECNHYIESQKDVSGVHQCIDCSRFGSCIDCQQSAFCGWCSDDADPREGTCVGGDFSGPDNSTCTAYLDKSQNTSWSFRTCPDLLECTLGRHDCSNITEICIETLASFYCECKRGFVNLGAGCVETCYHDCVHGECVSLNRTSTITQYSISTIEPVSNNFECKCDIGWTGDSCDTDCQCNNHSTCTQGVQKCDSCQHYTYGSSCENCQAHTFGNATSKVGCTPCMCHKHGDSSRGVCHSDTGVCYCTHQTTGPRCERCLPGFVGDPKNGRECFKCYNGRTVFTNFNGTLNAGNRACQLGHGFNTTTFMWVITTQSNISETSDHNTPLLLDMYYISEHINFMNPIYVYDSIPTSVFNTADTARVKRSEHQPITGEKPIAIITSSNQMSALVISQSGVLSLLYFNEYPESSSRQFQFRVTGLSCPSSCPSHYNRECVDNQCVCRSGYTGVDCNERVNCLRCNSTDCLTDGCSLKTSIDIRQSYISVICDTSLIIHGGIHPTTSRVYNHALIYNINNNQIIKTAAVYPRFHHSAVCLNNNLYLYAGFNERMKITKTLWSLNQDGSDTTYTTTNPPYWKFHPI